LHALGIEVTINTLPSEVQHPIRYDIDEIHSSHDPVHPQRFWHIMVQTDAGLRHYRSPFLGKSSPHPLLLGQLRPGTHPFLGRRAPERPGADHMTREAYSHEVISCGFWPGDDRFPAFYSYTPPEPPGLPTASIRPEAAFYSQELGLFLLRFEDVRTASSPELGPLEFFQSTYDSGAQLAQWDRKALEKRVR
jgi:hypothetical protein